MAAAGGSGQEIRGNGGSQEQAKVALPQSATGTGVCTVSPHSGETRPAQEFMEAVRKRQEDIPTMGVAEVLAYEEYLRVMRLRVLQRIKEEEEKAAAAEQATVPEPRRAG